MGFLFMKLPLYLLIGKASCYRTCNILRMKIDSC